MTILSDECVDEKTSEQENTIKLKELSNNIPEDHKTHTSWKCIKSPHPMHLQLVKFDTQQDDSEDENVDDLKLNRLHTNFYYGVTHKMKATMCILSLRSQLKELLNLVPSIFPLITSD